MSNGFDGATTPDGQGTPNQQTPPSEANDARHERIPGDGAAPGSQDDHTQVMSAGSVSSGSASNGPVSNGSSGWGSQTSEHPFARTSPGPQGWYPAPHHPGSPQQPSGHGVEPSQSRNAKKVYAAVGSSALLAAALASAGTYAVVHSDSGNGDIASGPTTIVKADPSDFSDSGAINWSATAAKVSPSVVSITVTSGSTGGEGSGVILDSSGNIVTNNHVVTGAGANAQVAVTLSNNRTYKASVVGTDPSTDLAVIRIKNAGKLTPIAMGDDSKLIVGQPVMAVGNPLGLAGTVTTGIVSALDRPVTTSESQSDTSSTSTSTVVTNAIQTSAAINPGNSGGALVSGSGKLIGINSSIASLSSSDTSSQSGNIGIGFAIPTTVVKNITDQLISKGKAQHALLGIGTEETEVQSGNATLTAAKVSSVESGSGAAKAGLKVNDAIIAIDGEPVTSANALVGQVRSRTIGSTVKLSVIRSGKEQTIDVTLGTAPSSN